MSVKVKICGVRDASTARVAVESGASFVGLVFAKGSPRRVTAEQAKEIVAAIRDADGGRGRVEPVALFVDRSVEEMRATCSRIGVSLVQLHGDETPEVVKGLAPLRVIKAIAASGNWAEALAPWRLVAGALAGVLADAPPPAGAARDFRGGHGQAFDWHGLARASEAGALRGLPPLFLAGGLTPANVAEAITVVRPEVVDVSSGVESSRGVKDHGMIRAFCAAALG